MKAVVASAWDDDDAAESESESSPAEAVGEWLLQARAARGLSARTLAERAGCSASLISQIEHGLVSPSVATLDRICRALGATLADCVAALGERPDFIVRRATRRPLAAVWSQSQLESLGPAAGGAFLSHLITVDPGGRSGSAPSVQATDEFAFVLQGRLVLTLRGEEHELQASDAVTLPARERRLWENRTEAPAKVLVVAGCR
jgi:transcriptional regulator with XRE-family HTH domain